MSNSEKVSLGAGAITEWHGVPAKAEDSFYEIYKIADDLRKSFSVDTAAKLDRICLIAQSAQMFLEDEKSTQAWEASGKESK